MTVRAAAQLCQGARVDRQYRIAVAGFFRPGPENHGPDRVGGALFDSDSVPKDAAVHIGRYHGIPFGVAVGWKFVGSIDGITRPHAGVAVRGVLFCFPGAMPFLKPNVIAVRTGSISLTAGVHDSRHVRRRFPEAFRTRRQFGREGADGRDGVPSLPVTRLRVLVERAGAWGVGALGQ
jgi:hypothetical protein